MKIEGFILQTKKMIYKDKLNLCKQSFQWIKLLDGSRVSRDVIGARNILIRALVDLPTGFSCAVNFC